MYTHHILAIGSYSVKVKMCQKKYSASRAMFQHARKRNALICGLCNTPQIPLVCSKTVFAHQTKTASWLFSLYNPPIDEFCHNRHCLYIIGSFAVSHFVYTIGRYTAYFGYLLIFFSHNRLFVGMPEGHQESINVFCHIARTVCKFVSCFTRRLINEKSGETNSCSFC